jgi:hypothetical protein
MALESICDLRHAAPAPVAGAVAALRALSNNPQQKMGAGGGCGGGASAVIRYNPRSAEPPSEVKGCYFLELPPMVSK